MEQESILLEVIKQYQKKYGIVGEIYRLTNEIAEALSRNDQVSSQLLLDMRQEEMDQADQCDNALTVLLEAMTPGDREHLKAVLQSKPGDALAETWEEKKALEICGNIRSSLQRTIEIDRRINLKIAGANSYYQKAR